MAPSDEKRLRITILAEGHLDKAEAAGFAALFARCGFPLEIVKPGRADLSIQYGEEHGNHGRRADFVMTRYGFGTLTEVEPELRRAIDAMRVANAVSPRSVPLPDLPALFHSILTGVAEVSCKEDDHGRTAPADCVPARLHVLDRPILDELARWFGQLLSAASLHPGTKPRKEWIFSPTFDIDSAGMFHGRNLLRSFRDITRRRPAALPSATGLAVRTWIHAARDPHLRIRNIAEIVEGFGAPATFFVQVFRRHLLDNYDLSKSPPLQRELRRLLDGRFHAVGLHSSYATRDASPAFFQDQWAALRRHVGPRISAVHRAHYLRAPLRMDYWSPWRQELVDSSLGFGAREGFRRGTCHPFRPAKGVIEIPPLVMDTTLRYFRHMGPDAALERCLELMDRVAAVGGTFIPIFHPHNLEEFLWPGWRNMLVDLMSEAKRRGAGFQSLASAARKGQARADLYEEILRPPST